MCVFVHNVIRFTTVNKENHCNMKIFKYVVYVVCMCMCAIPTSENIRV